MKLKYNIVILFRSSWISWPLAFLFQGVFDDKEGSNDVPVRSVV